jgi:uncharacterized protein (AIM24 family)
MTDVEQRIQCRWCHAQSPSSARSCDRCGAPLDVRDAVTDSGWREAPRLRDLTQFHWSASSAQLDAGVVPVVEVNLTGEDSVFFEHYAMLWKDETVPMSVMNSPGGARRLVSGMPFVLSVARAPGKVAFSRDATGELVVIPVEAPAEVDVREHALVLATSTLAFSYEKIGGFRMMLAADAGMYLDRFVAQTAPGLLVLHGYGNVFQRTLGEGETILIDPGAFFYKDSKVTMEVISINMKGRIEDAGGGTPAAPGAEGAPDASAAPAAPAAPAAEPAKKGGMFGRLKGVTSMVSVGGLAQAAGSLRSGGGLGGVAAALVGGGGATMFKMTGPGRVGIQSMFQPHKTGSE